MQIKNYQTAIATEWQAMVGSEAIGLPLVKHGSFAADMLNFRSGQQTSLHTHPGNHILFVVEGDGWVDFGDKTYDLVAGTCYFVPGSTPHRVRAGSGLTLLSIADNHRLVNSVERLEVIAW